jgi:hypothetical protein
MALMIQGKQQIVHLQGCSHLAHFDKKEDRGYQSLAPAPWLELGHPTHLALLQPGCLELVAADCHMKQSSSFGWIMLLLKLRFHGAQRALSW